jgi:hypothetical protein
MPSSTNSYPQRGQRIILQPLAIGQLEWQFAPEKGWVQSGQV